MVKQINKRDDMKIERLIECCECYYPMLDEEWDSNNESCPVCGDTCADTIYATDTNTHWARQLESYLERIEAEQKTQ